MRFIIGMLVLGMVFAACQDNQAGGPRTFKSTEDSVSYAIGMNIGKGMKTDSIKIDPDLLASGIRDALAGKTVFNDTVAQKTLMSFQQILMKKQQDRMQREQDSTKKAGEGNKVKADAFLAENKKKPGIIAMPNGLQYEVIKEGTGALPTLTDMVQVNYRGTLMDGTEFDASKGSPAEFNVGGVIPGWTQALKMMKVGSKWRLWIPPDLGYGMTPPPGGKIPSGSLLIFEVELVGIKPPQTGKPGGAPQQQPMMTPPPGGPGH